MKSIAERFAAAAGDTIRSIGESQTALDIERSIFPMKVFQPQVSARVDIAPATKPVPPPAAERAESVEAKPTAISFHTPRPAAKVPSPGAREPKTVSFRPEIPAATAPPIRPPEAGEVKDPISLLNTALRLLKKPYKAP